MIKPHFSANDEDGDIAIITGAMLVVAAVISSLGVLGVLTTFCNINNTQNNPALHALLI